MKKIQWNNLSLASKIVLQVGIIAALLLVLNIVFYVRLNHSMQKLDSVYSSNVDITLLSDSFTEVQDNMYQYLKVKGSEVLRDYYQSEAKYRALLEKLNDQNVDSTVKLLERDIRRMSETYLDSAAQTVTAKRARNVEGYKALYEETTQLYGYICSAIDELNNQLFINNNQRYETLRQFLRYLETSNVVVMLLVVACGIFFLSYSSRDMVSPLASMADTARLVGEGNFNVKMPPAQSQDELGMVTAAFNTMVESLGEYMERTRESMEKEQKMMERELLMENHLKEAQLKFLQSQINPHFLFNSLNAGVQLAMMEDAEKTGIFVEKMAEFFRYNVKKGQEDATLGEELEAVDNYIYILNVRFAGDIHFTKEEDKSLLDVKMPSMILQPIVENAVNHGIRDIDREGRIHLSVAKEESFIRISVKDNGAGMTKEQIEKVLSGTAGQNEEQKDSTGVGMNNVISRLELYYEQKELLKIYSGGEGKGTEVVLTIPMNRREENVSNTISG